MEPITVAGVLLAGWAGLSTLGIVSLFVRSRHRAARRTALAELGVACGLIDGAAQGRDGYAGRHGVLAVRLETSVLGRVRPVARLTIEGIVRDLSLQPKGVLARIEEARGTEPFETGDPAFDGAVHARGAPLTLHAFLDAETRALACEVLLGRPFGRDALVSIAGGSVSAEVSGEWFEDLPRLADGVRALLTLAHRLEPADAESERLGRIARTDPLVGVRLTALTVLQSAFPRRDETARALRHGCEDAHPEVRLGAARLVGGKQAWRTLGNLARAAEAPDEVSAAAIDAVAGNLDREELRAILARSSAGRPRSHEAIVRLLANGGSDDAAAIAAAMERFDDTVAATAAEALGTIGDPGAEDALITAAARPGREIRIAAAHALGVLGSARAVPVLHELEGDGGPVLRAAREAVVAIQSRLSGASAGQVALAGGDEGRVALAESGGAVALPKRTGG